MLENVIKVKPLSANRMFGARGRRTFKSPDYVAYQEAIAAQLEGVEWPFGSDQVSVEVEAGLSNRGADIDNIIKPVLDTYQLIFEGFNDNKVYHVELHKQIVPKGDEYLRIRISGFTGRVPVGTGSDKTTGSQPEVQVKEA